MCARESEIFEITGDWKIIQVVSDSGQEYDPDRGMIWTFSGTSEEGDISTDVSFLSGTYRVRGKLITMEIVSGRGPYWYNRYYSGIITGHKTMQGQYEGSSLAGDSEEAVTFSGSWWAIKK